MKVLIIDDDKMICIALKSILESDESIKIVDMGFSYSDAVNMYSKHSPDILLIDIQMKDKTGLEAGRQIIKDYPNAKILYLTTFLETEYIIKAINMGAKGYLLKKDFEHIIPAIKAVFAGQNVFGNDVVSELPKIKQVNIKKHLEEFSLTTKEIEILEEIANGLNNKEISHKLYLSEGTVRNYTSTILEKLDLRDRTQLALFYLGKLN